MSSTEESGASIIRTGWATKRGQIKKSWKRRYFVLRSDMSLSYYKSGTSQSKPKVFNCVVDLSGRLFI